MSGLLAGWLRRAVRHPDSARLVLRGSLVLAARVGDGARPPADVDYLVLGEFDAGVADRLAREIAALPDPAGATVLAVAGTEVIFAETANPGLRAFVDGRAGDEAASCRFQVDLAFGDPLAAPPVPVTIAGVGAVPACTTEVLFGWKLHGLVEHGRGTWRPKDLFDLDLMARRAAMDHVALRAAVEVAFASRALPLAALDDFLDRDSWGLSRSGVRKWRQLRSRHAAVDDFLATRARVRARVADILGDRPGPRSA